MIEKIIIKNCPFCGSNAIIKDAKYKDIKGYADVGKRKHWYGVYCSNCHVGQPKRTYFSKEEAINKWNEREKND